MIAGEKTSIGISFVVVILGCWSLLLALQKINKVSNVFLQLKAGYMNYKKYHLEKDKGIFNEQVNTQVSFNLSFERLKSLLMKQKIPMLKKTLRNICNMSHGKQFLFQ